MATVYLAEDLKHKRKVAVKVLRPELAAVLCAERFVQEITTTANRVPFSRSWCAGSSGWCHTQSPQVTLGTLLTQVCRFTVPSNGLC